MRRSAAILIAMLITLAGCGAQSPVPSAIITPEPAIESVTPTELPKPDPTPTPTPTSVPTQTPQSLNISHTTGLPFYGEYRPIMIVIENSAKARPQLGLQTADVVYEVPVEGSTTRFVCVFSDNVPKEVMPVRSGRVPFLFIQREWNAIFMHFGGSGSRRDHNAYSFYGHKLYDKIITVVDGLKGNLKGYFYRDKKKPSTHDVVGKPLRAQALYKYQPEPLNWLFDDSIEYSGEIVPKINLKMCSGNKNFVSYKYDPDKNVYMRYMGGKKFMSAETGKQVSVKNVIVQHSTYEVELKIKLWKLVGEGKADFYIGGKHIKGSWKRESEASKTIYYDAVGNQIVLLPGNTWIHLSPAK